MTKLDSLHLLFQAETQCSERKAKEYTQRYIDSTAIQILKHLNKSEDGMFYISHEELRRQINKVEVNGLSRYIIDVFERIPGRIFTKIEQGNNITNKLTKIKMNYTLEELLIATSDREELVKELYKDFNDEINRDEVDWIPIDVKSLNAFIQGNMNVDRSSLNDKAQQTYNDYLFHATRIKLIAEKFDGLMPNVIASTNFARKYYKGPNLQNVNKIVRNAALGDCFEYDIESSVFAWKYSWYKNHCNEMNYQFCPLSYTSEYLSKKSALRRMIAKNVFDTDEEWAVKLIKQCLTAIGFGAPLKVVGYISRGKYEATALNTIITARHRLEKFIENPWIKSFYAEQEVINELIIENIKSIGEDEHLKTIPELVNAKNLLKKNSVVSYKYQQSERAILEWLIETCEASDVILTVHDCIYTRKPIDLRTVRSELREIGEYYKISEDKHRAFAYDPYIQDHRKFIAEQERLAKGYKGEWSDAGRTNVKSHKERTQVDLYTGEHTDFYDGTGYDGTNQYNEELDPFLDDLTELERSEYRVDRNRILKSDSDLPEWYRK